MAIHHKVAEHVEKNFCSGDKIRAGNQGSSLQGGIDGVNGFANFGDATTKGIDLEVRWDTPVEGLETTLQAEVIYQGQTRALTVSPRFGQPGWYQSVFFPTAAGPYTFHIFGTVEGTPIDESFTSSPDGFSEVEVRQIHAAALNDPDGFNEVEDQAGGQFPVQIAAPVDVARDAEAGAAAAGTATLGLVLGGAGLLVGLVALGISLAGRRRAS